MPAGTRNRHSFPDEPLLFATRAETMIWPAALPSSTAVLWPLRRQPSGVFVAIVSTLARSKRAARSECARARISEPSAIFGQDRLLLRLAAAFRDQRRADHHRGEIRLGDEAAAKGFHQDADLDRAAAEPAKVFADRQRQPAEIGKLFPDRRAEAERLVRRLAAMVGVVGLVDKAVGTFAQQPLLVAQD